MGRPLSEARGEVKYGADFVRWYAEEAVRPVGSFREPPDGGASLLTRRSPVGLAVLITPWNFPLAMATRKIAPALAAGCPVVIKPATLTPLTTHLAVQLAVEAGVPEDLIQVITTSDSAAFSEAVLTDPRVRKVSFTGSTPVGRQLLKLAARNVLRTSMELGGNAPLIVFDDADLQRAVDGTFAAKLRNGGQSCIGANRIYVQNGIADDFASALAERFTQIPVGSGLGRQTGLGP
ncbi:acyl-CoA reductase-like NAD-dependent aldehyde dehydrogenase [Arthrobacter sp. B3I9]|nr:acyl-CoA reductase-like NAD-dependent aldehyde dehydrogenase [Arthrobacter sp. B3I9]